MMRRGPLFSSLSARVIGLSALMTLGIIGIAFTLTYISAQRIFEFETAAVVQDELDDLKGTQSIVDLKDAIDQRSDVDQSEAVYLLVNSRGERVAGNIAGWPAAGGPDGKWARLQVVRDNKPVEIGARTYWIEDASLRRWGLLVGRDLRAQQRFSIALAESGALAMLAAVLLASAAAYLLNRVVMRRIGDIDLTARAIVAGDLTRRIPTRDGGDEFGRLAVTLNAMLERIETLVVELRTVTDSLAHDLRTPLTRLKTQIRRSADGELTVETRREALGAAADEADRMLAFFQTMIDMARAEAGASRDQFTLLDLAEVVRGVWELHAPLADEMGAWLTFEAEEEAEVMGHEQFLAQMVSNLVDNALKYGVVRAQAKSEIALRVRVEHGMAELTVADHGPGIPPEQRDTALKRFGRLDDARTKTGSGLGLSLAATLARMHGGELTLEDNQPGLRVKVIIPLAGAPAA